MLTTENYKIERENRTKVKKGGRPRKELDREQIITLAEIQCTYEEIAAVMRVTRDTLRDNYSSEIELGRERGKTVLRRAQWHKAVVEANPYMLQWLGRFYLDQKENQKVEVNFEPLVRTLLKKMEEEK